MKSRRSSLFVSALLTVFLLASSALPAAGCRRNSVDRLYDPSAKVSPEAISFDSALRRKVLSFFAGKKLCTAGYAEDAEEGLVLKISSSGVSSADPSRPSLRFDYGGFCRSLGEEPADLNEKPFVVLKVKPVSTYGRLISLTAANALDELSIHGDEHAKRIPEGDGWQYVVFDLSEERNLDVMNFFSISFEQLALKNGETLLVSEMRFCTADEAAIYNVSETYEIVDGGGFTLRILQFNIQTEAGNSAPFALRSEMVRKLVDETVPDIAGLQEVTPAWKKWLLSNVFNDSYDCFGEERVLGSEANTVFYRKDKFDLLESGTFWLSPTPDVKGSSYPNSSFVRVCTWGHFRDKATGTEFVSYNLHLDINGDKEKSEANKLRADQMATIVRHAARFSGLPVFVSGDFNSLRTKASGDTHDVIKLVEGSLSAFDGEGNEYKLQLRDSRLFAVVTVDEGKTATLEKYHDKTYEKYDPGREPIDYVFYDPAFFEPLTYNTYILKEGSYRASDHLALFATFKLIPDK